MSNTEPKMILIVDDTPRNLQLLAEILYDEGFEIGVAESGFAALEYLDEIKPDIILLDIMMPGMDGFETNKKIKEMPECADIPIIYLTAKTDTESTVKAFKSGAADYVTKPFNASELIARVRTHLELQSKKNELAEMNIGLEKLVEAKTEELRKANKQLSELDTTKSYFIGLMAHELNTPLTGIIGGTNIIKEMSNDPDTREFADLVLASAERLHRFSQMSRLIAELSLEHYRYNVESRDVNSFILDITENFKRNHVGKPIEVYCNVPDTEYKISLDYSLIEKMIVELLDNAYKFTDKGSIEVCCSADKYFYTVEIKDTGRGFTEKALENAFKLFESDELMSHSDGLGLSLAISKMIMDHHSGTVSARNNPTGGACITLKFSI